MGRVEIILMKNKVYKVVANVWKWPGYAGWHFINIPKETSIKIKKSAKTYGAGFVKIKARVGNSSWQTALFPHKESDSYLLSIKNSIRKKEGVYDGESVTVFFELI